MDDLIDVFLNFSIQLESWLWPINGVLFALSAIGLVLSRKFKKPSLMTLTYFAFITSFWLGPGLNWVLINYWQSTLPSSHQQIFWLQFFITPALTYWFSRNYSGKINVWYLSFMKRHYDRPTDIRTVKHILPKSIDGFNPEEHFNQDIFIGLDAEQQPVNIPYSLWRESHIDVVGTTRSGKGVAICVMLYQAVLKGETVFVIDPKGDTWAPFVLKKAADAANAPYHYIDLNPDTPGQWNPFTQANCADIEGLFSAGFGLSEKGTESDVYRIDDRFMALRAAEIASQMNSPSFQSIYAELSQRFPKLHDQHRFFAGALREMAELASVNANTGFDLPTFIHQAQGGVCYIKGSMDNPRVIKAQKMFAFRIMQLSNQRDEMAVQQKPIALFLDEYKYLISNITLQALGASLGKGLHAILAHQSLQDLRACSADLDAEMVRGSVIDNTAIKLCYQPKDPETAEFYSRLSGKMTINREIKSYGQFIGHTFVEQTNRQTHESERYYIDENMLLNLPPRCCVVYGLGLAKPIFTSPIQTSQQGTAKQIAEQTQQAPSTPTTTAEELINVD